MGCPRIGTISGLAASTVGIDRKEDCLKALGDHGLPVDETLIAEGDFTELGGYAAMQALLSARPRAILTAATLGHSLIFLAPPMKFVGGAS